MGGIYKGLAQTGAWGCFDEFNRIPVAVLSVCSTQYKTVLDAIRARKERFVFEDNEISLKSTVMAFITMNPGYPGRAELPESLKVPPGSPHSTFDHLTAQSSNIHRMLFPCTPPSMTLAAIKQQDASCTLTAICAE